jgi:decaprenyl-phosphate phosphoribosyltransferase
MVPAGGCGILASRWEASRSPLPAAVTGGEGINPLQAPVAPPEAHPEPEARAQIPSLALVQGAVARPAAEPRRAAEIRLATVVRACRPRQWSKNLLVLAAPCSAGLIDNAQVALQAAGAFVVMCLVSSATYLVNDVRDRRQDRLHPAKRRRPVASGELSPTAALWIAAALAVTGIGLGIAIAPGLGAVAAGYLLLTASYSLWWRHVVVADIIAIAAGFVLRAVAGGVATDIYLSRYFVLVTAFGAIFLVAAKRYAELREQSGPRPARATLRRYTVPALRALLAAAAAGAAASYISWAFTRPDHLAWYIASIVPFIGWMARYARLIGAGAGQAPEELVLGDAALLALSVTWGLLFLGGVYGPH